MLGDVMVGGVGQVLVGDVWIDYVVEQVYVQVDDDYYYGSGQYIGLYSYVVVLEDGVDDYFVYVGNVEDVFGDDQFVQYV